MIEVGDEFEGDGFTATLEGFVGDEHTGRIDGYLFEVRCEDGVIEWPIVPAWCVEDLGTAH